jgi:hypothetical protein
MTEKESEIAESPPAEHSVDEKDGGDTTAQNVVHDGGPSAQVSAKKQSMSDFFTIVSLDACTH